MRRLKVKLRKGKHAGLENSVLAKRNSKREKDFESHSLRFVETAQKTPKGPRKKDIRRESSERHLKKKKKNLKGQKEIRSHVEAVAEAEY